MLSALAPLFFLVGLAVVMLFKSVIIVPQRQALIVERLGKYHETYTAGFHILIPFIDRKAYWRSLKEDVIDVPAQQCITSDNVQVNIDGVLYLQVVDPQKSAYGISDYEIGAIQLAQTSLRSAIGKMALDRTFESRDQVNQEVCSDLNAATSAWGVKVLRYEIRDLTPPQSIMQAMERQVKAEREKRAVVLQSEGEKQSAINKAEGERASAIARSEGEKQSLINQSIGIKESMINKSEGERQAQINRAAGEASRIQQIAEATANGLASIKGQMDGDAVAAAQLKLAEAYITQFGNLAKSGNSIIIPADAANVGNIMGTITGILRPGQGLNIPAAKLPGQNAAAAPAPQAKPLV